MTPVRTQSLFSSASTYFIANILNAAIPFALLPVLTRYLSPVEYGKVAMFQTFVGLLSGFVGLNVAGAAARKYYDVGDDKEQLRGYLASCFVILLVSGTAVGSVVALSGDYLSRWLALESGWLLLGVLVSATSIVLQLRLVQWQVRGQARLYGTLQVGKSALEMLLSLWLVVALVGAAAGRIEAQVWASALACVVALFSLVRDRLLLIREWSPGFIKEALKFGLPLVPHVVGGFLLASVDRFVINAELGLADAGAYMVAVQLVMGMAIVFDALNKAYVPWLFERLKRNDAQEKRLIVRLTYLWFGVIAMTVMLAFLLGPAAVVLIAGHEYAAAGKAIGWLALGQGFSGMYLMVTNYIFYSKRTGLLSVVTIVSGLLNLALLFWLIEVLGLEGAAVAFSVSMCARFLLTWWIAQKRHPMPWFG